MEREAGPFGPHPTSMSTPHPLPSGAGSCTVHRGGSQPGRALSPSQEGGELSRPQPGPFLGAQGAGAGRTYGLWRGQRGAERLGGSWKGTSLRGDREGRDGEGMGL